MADEPNLTDAEAFVILNQDDSPILAAADGAAAAASADEDERHGDSTQATKSDPPNADMDALSCFMFTQLTITLKTPAWCSPCGTRYHLYPDCNHLRILFPSSL